MQEGCRTALCALAHKLGGSAPIFICMRTKLDTHSAVAMPGTGATTTDSLAWVSTSTHQPRDRQLVYARVKGGQPKKVTFYARPTPRWEGSNLIYDSQYFTEWAALEAMRKSA